MAKKEKKKWVSLSTKAFKSNEDLKKALMKESEKTLAVDMSFEELIKLSVSEPNKEKPKSN
jgi:hypothetical protein